MSIRTGGDAASTRPGFTLAELLVVITIIVVLIAITFPALSGARKGALTTTSLGLITEVQQASASFANDNSGRAPGLFSAREMGAMTNGTTTGADMLGLSAMENAMLDLAGADAVLGQEGDFMPAAEDVRSVLVGPSNDPDAIKYWVNPDLLAGPSSYIRPSPKNYVPQLAGSQQITDDSVSDLGHAAATETEPQLPDLVDSFGQPLLLWVEDEFAPTNLDQDATDIDMERLRFAAIDSDSGPARFYWASNAAFLAASQLGVKGEDMTVSPDDGTGGSLIGSGAADGLPEEEFIHTLAGLFGSTAFPKLYENNDVSMAYAQEDLLPQASRGRLIVHSAGADGIYLSSKDDGAGASVAPTGNHFEFGFSFYPPGSSTQRGQPIDLVEPFDDIIQGSNF